MPAARHDAFTVRLPLEAAPDAVWAAFTDPARRRRWIRMPGASAAVDEDVRVGGSTVARSTFRTPEGEERLENVAHHLVLDPPHRLVWAYTASVDEVVRWSSLVTVELEPAGAGTALSWTEQVAFLVASAVPEDDLLHLRGAARLRLNGLAAAAAP